MQKYRSPSDCCEHEHARKSGNSTLGLNRLWLHDELCAPRVVATMTHRGVVAVVLIGTAFVLFSIGPAIIVIV